MSTKIHSTSIVVGDQERALAFYTGVLGWEKDIDHDMGDGQRFFTVRPPGDGMALQLGQPEMHDRAAPGSESLHTGISLIATDIRATLDELRANGAMIVKEPEEMVWGSVGGHVADPDGNVYFVVEERSA